MSRHANFKIFSMLFGLVYTLAFYFDWSLFRYYPAVAEFHLKAQPKDAGPAILWYGWMATAALVSAGIALIVPRKWADRLSPGLTWIVPAVILVVVVIYEKRWFV